MTLLVLATTKRLNLRTSSICGAEHSVFLGKRNCLIVDTLNHSVIDKREATLEFGADG